MVLGRKLPAVALTTLLIAALFAFGQMARADHDPGHWDEQADGGGNAGDLPATAQVPTGTGELSLITGTLDGFSDVDMFAVCLLEPQLFSAMTVTSDDADPMLFLFDEDGYGIYFNDDIQEGPDWNLDAKLPAGHDLGPSEAGRYYLAISSYSLHAHSESGLIFPVSPFSEVHGPTGPGGEDPVTGWSGLGETNVGAYQITLTGAAHPSDCDDPEPTVVCYDLIAGQHILAGEVCVSNDDENLYVEYTTTDGWMLVETHLAVSRDDTGGGEWTENRWQNRTGNPAPGQFPHSDPHGAEESYLYTIALDEIGGEGDGDELNIAAHAVVEREDVIAEATAPYFASSVVDSQQGQRTDGTDVLAERSDPEQALRQEADDDDSKMFSLGFGGWVTVEFTCPIQNGGEGVDDLSIWEVTNPGGYPLEQALVAVSQDGETWFEVGTADNLTPETGRLTLSSFDLTTAGLDWARYVRVTDTSDPDLFEPTADGFDLDGVQANTDCRISEIERESAWGDGERFVNRGDWAMYFEYELETLEPVD